MNTINKLILMFSTTIILSTPLYAGTVTNLKSFTKGTPAVSADVNNNFNSLKTAVDDNDLRVKKLENSNPGTGDLSVTLTGTVNVDPSTVAVRGNATLFTSELQVGTVISIENEIHVVKSISSNTNLVLEKAHVVGAQAATAFTDGDLLLLTDSAGQNKLKVDKSGSLIFRRQALSITPVKMAFSRIDGFTISFTDVDGSNTLLSTLNSLGNNKIRLYRNVNINSYTVGGGGAAVNVPTHVISFNIGSSPSSSCTLLHAGGLLVSGSYSISTGSNFSPTGWEKTFTIGKATGLADDSSIPIPVGAKFEIICF